MPDGEKEREVPIEGIAEIFNPTWAPDGHAICFTGMSRGLTDLYVYYPDASRLQRLTNDPFADLQPAWSPDGKRIAFATDRFSSNLTSLIIGDYRLATIDTESGRIEQVRAFTRGKNLNPQWTPDGGALMFLSDRDGIPNLYRVGLATGEVEQLTHVATGLSGITSTSPALSVAANSGTAAFSIYSDGKYSIHVLAPAERGTTLTAGSATAADGGLTSGSATPIEQGQAGVLPPLDRKTSEVEALLRDPDFGLPPATDYETSPYKAKLSLEGIAQPSVAVGASQFGAALGGGVGFQFGDMLGDQTLTAAVQLQTGVAGSFSFKDTAAQVMYFNAKNRWNWGIIGAQFPYLSGGFQSGFGQVGNEPAQIDQTIVFRQTEQSVGGIVAYPLNRAQRVELHGGVTRLTVDQIVQTQAYSLNTGDLLVDNSTTTSFQAPLTLGTTSAALVYDTSNFGATSPVTGSRYRLEVSPAFGSVDYTGVLADYRRYFMPVSFYTIAARAMHYGRYGSGAEDPRLYPLFIGYPSLVRGYDLYTFEPQECPPSPTNSCPTFDNLFGSRVLVGNLEFRFPLLRPFGASQRMYGPVPVEVALFTDAGVAWNQGQTPALFGGTRHGVASSGVALRVNLLGFAVGEFDFSRPFQREGRGWIFQFNLSPGW